MFNFSCSAEEATKFPVLTFSSGPTNSMRGAAFLSGIPNAIVVDVGGSTTDVGVLRNGFPREAGSQCKVESNYPTSSVVSWKTVLHMYITCTNYDCMCHHSTQFQFSMHVHVHVHRHPWKLSVAA